MVAIPTKNNLSPQDNPEAQPSDIADNQESCTSNSVAGGGDNEEPQHLSRAERLEKHKMQVPELDHVFNYQCVSTRVDKKRSEKY